MSLRERADIFAARRNLGTVDMRQDAGVAVHAEFQTAEAAADFVQVAVERALRRYSTGTGTVDVPPFAGAASRWLRSASAFCRALISAAWLLLLAGASAVCRLFRSGPSVNRFVDRWDEFV